MVRTLARDSIFSEVATIMALYELYVYQAGLVRVIVSVHPHFLGVDAEELLLVYLDAWFSVFSNGKKRAVSTFKAELFFCASVSFYFFNQRWHEITVLIITAP